MFPDDPTRPQTRQPRNQSGGNGHAVLSEAEFHKKTQLVAQALLEDVSTQNGRLKPGAEPIRVEKALSAAKQVIESIRRARDTLHKAHEDQEFERAVISAAQALPDDYQKVFIAELEKALEKAEPYH